MFIQFSISEMKPPERKEVRTEVYRNDKHMLCGVSLTLRHPNQPF